MAQLERTLRRYSPLAWAFERLFRLLQVATPARLFGTRVEHQESAAFAANPIAETERRAYRIELYVIAWLVIELAMLARVDHMHSPWVWLVRALAGCRIIDIVQATVSLTVFDQLRATRGHRIASISRTLVLSFVNFAELLACFAVLYASAPTSFDPDHPLNGCLNALYFSVVTQLTIGYGDILPLGAARALVAVQSVVGIVFTVLIFGRVVSLLPGIDAILQDPRGSAD